MPVIYPVILSGGIGSRLWPLSKADFPKQFHALYSDKPMIIETALRVCDDQKFAKPTIICNQAHRFLVQSVFEEYQIDVRAILLEPCLRDTAPAIAAAAFHIHQEDPTGQILILPSDHYIKEVDKFQKAITKASDNIVNNSIATFGISPTKPETGYGYIKLGEERTDSIFDVTAFIEKPDLATAEQYISSKNYVWNAGIFLSSTEKILEEFKKHQSDVYHSASLAVQNSVKDLGFTRLDTHSFSACPKVSFDYAIMEKTSCAMVAPLTITWNDLGSWNALWEIADKDDQGNHTQGNVVALDTTNSYLRSDCGLNVAAIGIEDCVLVASDNAIVIAQKSHTQKIKQIFEQIRENDSDSHHIQSIRSHQPWGHSDLVQKNEHFTAKLVFIQPYQKTALQKHALRTEHWVVLEGEITVLIDGVSKIMIESDSISILPHMTHAMYNHMNKPAKIFEVQSGTLLETDITRIDEYKEQST